MPALFRILLVIAALSAIACNNQTRAETTQLHYSLGDTLPLPGSTSWDYLAFDVSGHRLFITRGDSVDILDVNSKKIIALIPNLDGVHGVALAPESNRGYITEGKANRVTVFDLTTYKVVATVPTGNKPDAIVYDKTTRQVFVADGESGDLTVINATSNAVLGKVPLNGQPEFAITDGKARLYVNLEDKSQIAVVDTKSLKVLAHYDLAPGCESPTGLAMDQANNRLFSVCANKTMVIIDAAGGQIIDTLPIGEHSDAAAFDATTGLAFSSNGDGTLTIVGSSNSGHYKVLQTLQTKATARTMALDPTTHKIYLSAAEAEGFDPPTDKHPKPRPHIKPGTFMILTVNPSD